MGGLDTSPGMIGLLLSAGHETTVNLIGNGAVALLTHPTELDRLRIEPELMKSAVEELVRYSPTELIAVVVSLARRTGKI
ncbi:MAG: hypothetical protein PUP92_37175 [Rhizonema sp. PD38]|nr:hypothetical protein [Rhizonema sp. PD38]